MFYKYFCAEIYWHWIDQNIDVGFFRGVLKGEIKDAEKEMEDRSSAQEGSYMCHRSNSLDGSTVRTHSGGLPSL